jgi:phytoene/squalene synthetase
MLDTCEDLPRAVAEKEAALRAMVDRFDGAVEPRPAPRLADDGLAHDERDRVYLLLLRHAERVDRCFVTLPAAQREGIVRLVRRMGEGMIWAVRTFAEQGGALDGRAQLTRYCFEVLGNPLLFAEEMQRLEMGLPPEVDARRRELVAAVGEAIQLANVARDLEKDAVAGVFYDPTLRAGAGAPPPAAIAAVRGRLLGRAIVLGRAFRPYMEGVPTPRLSFARGAGLALLLFTLAFWQGTARRLLDERLHGGRTFGGTCSFILVQFIELKFELLDLAGNPLRGLPELHALQLGDAGFQLGDLQSIRFDIGPETRILASQCEHQRFQRIGVFRQVRKVDLHGSNCRCSGTDPRLRILPRVKPPQLSGKLRSLSAYRRPPVNAFQQIAELCRRDRHCLASRRGPDEPAAL